LSELPEDLFSYSPKARIISNTFRGCGMAVIPEQLFAGNPEVTNFGEAFRGCTSLQSIPSGLFDNNRCVTDFRMTFWGCWNMNCESPYTVIGGKKVHLYERKDYLDHFIAPIYYNGWHFLDGVFTDQEAIVAAGWE
jgi:hypothetical protein